MQNRLKIDGMSCNHCVTAIRKALQIAGVEIKSVGIGEAVVDWDPLQCDIERIRQAIDDAGYNLTSVE